jgi:tRNA(Ile)-lysidine synthase
VPRAAEGGLTTRALDAARASGLVRAGEPVLVMVSGGADSVCLLDVAVELGASVSALHVNYGLREGADGDEALVRELCGALEVPLHVERVELGAEHNLQAEARERRYALAERYAVGDYAAAHTASDQAETVLYRLAVSPGRRALLGMEPRRGRLVRPLLEATRDDTREWCRSRGLAWREDPSNADPRFARSRVRHDVLAALRDVNPAAELNIARTAALLRDEETVLRGLVDERMTAGAALQLATLRASPRAIARLVLREAAERAGVGLRRGDAERIMRTDDRGTKSVDVEGGRALVEYGTVRFVAAGGEAGAQPDPVRLIVPGAAEWGEWVVDARLGGFGDVSVDAAALGDVVTVRGWRDGDRMRPLGLGGSKSLQDLFVDRKIPREMRRTLPLVESESGEIAWVSGAEVVGEAFRTRPGEPAVALSAKRRTPLR